MQKRIKHQPKTRRPRDVNQLAHLLVEQSTAIPDAFTPSVLPDSISRYMAEIGRKGGRVGGKRRLNTLTEKERKDIAKKAAKARWDRSKRSNP